MADFDTAYRLYTLLSFLKQNRIKDNPQALQEEVDTLLKEAPEMELLKNAWSEPNSSTEEILRPLFQLMNQSDEHIKKLAAIFDEPQAALDYIAHYKKNMNEAFNFKLPDINKCDWPLWRKLAAKHLKNELFREILPQAAAIEASFKSSADNKKVKFATIDNARKEIEKYNLQVKHFRQHKHRDVAKQREAVKNLSDAKIALANLPLDFNEKTPLGDFTAHAEKLRLEDTSYQCFKKWGLTWTDYQKFKKLKRQDDDEQIPNIKVDGASIGYPGYYMMKVPVMDIEHAARAACFGKMTQCCQSFSGENGEPCVIHGLTSRYGGFYVLCKGDVNNPQVSDEVVGQSWAWRSKKGALVFDSIESSDPYNSDQTGLIANFYRHVAKTVTETTDIKRVYCGSLASGVGNKIGIEDPQLRNEVAIDYDGYSDATKQLVIYDKDRPYLLYNQASFAKEDTKRFVENIFLNLAPIEKNESFLALIKWAMNNDRKDLLEIISQQAKSSQRESEWESLYSRARSTLGAIHDLNAMQKMIGTGDFFIPLANGALERAILEKNSDLIDYLLEQKIGLNVMSGWGLDQTTPLIEAIRQNNYLLVERLVNAGAEVNLPTSLGQTPLQTAIINKKTDLKLIELLISKGANVNQKGIYYGNNMQGLRPIMDAIGKDRDDVVDLLLKHGANISLENQVGMNALSFTVSKKKFIHYMHLFNDLDVNTTSRFQRTPLMEAAMAGDEEACKVLIQKGAHLNHQDKAGFDALMIAIDQKHSNVAKILIDAGAKLNQKSLITPTQKDSLSPLSMSIERDNIESARLLLEHGALNVSNSDEIFKLVSNKQNSQMLELILDFLMKDKELFIQAFEKMQQYDIFIATAIRNKNPEIILYLITSQTKKPNYPDLIQNLAEQLFRNQALENFLSLLSDNPQNCPTSLLEEIGYFLGQLKPDMLSRFLAHDICKNTYVYEALLSSTETSLTNFIHAHQVTELNALLQIPGIAESVKGKANTFLNSALQTGQINIINTLLLNESFKKQSHSWQLAASLTQELNKAIFDPNYQDIHHILLPMYQFLAQQALNLENIAQNLGNGLLYFKNWCESNNNPKGLAQVNLLITLLEKNLLLDKIFALDLMPHPTNSFTLAYNQVRENATKEAQSLLALNQLLSVIKETPTLTTDEKCKLCYLAICDTSAKLPMHATLNQLIREFDPTILEVSLSEQAQKLAPTLLVSSLRPHMD